MPDEDSSTTTASATTQPTTEATKRRPCARGVLTYHDQVQELAEWVKNVVQEYTAKDDATFTLTEQGIELVPVANDGEHLAAVQAWEERTTQQTPASDAALILSCMFDGMATDGKEEYRRMHVWCKDRNHALHVLNAKKRQHQVYTAKDELKAVGSNIVQTLIGKMEQVSRRLQDGSARGPQTQRRADTDGKPDSTTTQDARAEPAAAGQPEAAASAAASSETETPAELAGVAQDTVVQPNPDNEWDCAGNDAYFAKLAADLRLRLLEGQGECMVKVGIDASGSPSGLSEDEFAKALATIQKLAEGACAAVSKVVEKTINKDAPRKCAELLVRQWGEEDYIDMRIAICGNVDSGKSTFVGVLTKGILDNGRGLVRQRVFRHRHEVETGRTSSISEQLIGFDSMGNVVNYHELKKEEELQHTKHQLSSKELSEKSAKMITFYDLAGHEKYLKTTVMGMTGSMPDYACIVISANNGIQRMTKEHLGLCLALKIPFFCVITSIDRCPDVVLKNTTASVVKILKQGGVHKLPYMVRNEDDVIICAKNIKDDRIAPIFHVSNVTGENLGLIRIFLNLLPVRKDWNSLAKLPAEVVIDSTFYVGGVGTVVGGIVAQGVLHPNDTILLGPNPNGHFRQAIIKSIHVKQVPVNKVEAGTAGCFALKKERRSDIRKGMVMLDARSRPAAVWEFEAEIVVLYHCTTIQSNYQPVVHIATVRQSCAITLIDCDLLRTGDKARCRFRFMYKPEYVKVGSKLIFREGRTKGLGTVTEIFP